MAFTKINAAGIGTTETVTVDGLTVINDGSFGGNLTVGGVLTYEDVTNVDSVGLITARNGIVVGSGITLSKDGDIFATGITTVTTVKSTTGIVTTLTATGLTVDSGTTNTCATFQSSDAGAVINLTDSSARSSISQNGTDLLIISDTDAGDADSTIKFQVDSGTKAIIDSSGRLLLGTTTEGEGDADDLTISTSGNTGITLRSGTSNDGAIFFSDGTSGTDEYKGTIQYLHSSDAFIFKTDASERLRIDSSGRVLIGTTTEGFGTYGDTLTLATSGHTGFTIRSGTTHRGSIYFSDGTSGDAEYQGYVQYNHDDGRLVFGTTATERLRIDSNGKILIGHTSHNSTIASGVGSQLQVEGTSYDTSGISLINNQAATDPAFLVFGKSRAGSNGGTTVVQNGDRLGAIRFAGADGTDLHSYGAEIACVVNGTPGSNDMPGQLLFATTADGSASPTTRLQIQADGKFFFGNDTSNQDSNNYVFVGTKAFSGGICQGQLAVADNNAYNFSNNGGSIGFQAKYNSSGSYTQMAAIEGRKANNTDGHYGGVLNFSTRTHNGNLTQAMYIDADQVLRTSSAIYVGSEINMINYAGTAQNKYFDSGHLNNTLHFRRTDGSDSNHTVQMYMFSNLLISGDFNDTSDGKLKTNKVDLADGALSKVNQFKPVTFDWIDSTRPNDCVGFIAQDLKSVVPNLVNGTEYDETETDEKGNIISAGYNVNTIGVVAYLTKALQELSAKNDALEARIAALEG